MQSGPIEESRKLHKANAGYSMPSAYSDKGKLKGMMELPLALKKTHLTHPVTRFLDYGCGQNGLINLLSKYDDFRSIEFNSDKYSEKPRGEFDILTCIDVLEHISRGQISSVLNDISGLTTGFFFFAIDLVPATKTLSDKRNAHILLAPPDWWCQQISSEFSCTRLAGLLILLADKRRLMYFLIQSRFFRKSGFCNPKILRAYVFSLKNHKAVD